jgi:hypothetical protein
MSLKNEKPDHTIETAADGIVSSGLTNCYICEDGKAIRLNLLDQAGSPAFVEFTFDQAECIAMTLPRLLTAALQSSSGRTDLRYVFSVDHWSLEESHGQSTLIFTLRTEDGFHASFGLSLKMCKDIGSAMKDLPTEATTNVAAIANKH